MTRSGSWIPGHREPIVRPGVRLKLSICPDNAGTDSGGQIVVLGKVGNAKGSHKMVDWSKREKP
jgi:hypothetical protein